MVDIRSLWKILTIVYLTLKIIRFLDFVQCSEFWITREKSFSKLDPFPCSGGGREMPTLLGPLERTNIQSSLVTKVSPFLRDPTE
jgi:hypothetical protein